MVLVTVGAACIGIIGWAIIYLHAADLDQLARLSRAESRLLRDERSLCTVVREDRSFDLALGRHDHVRARELPAAC